ncbi:MAG TPA: TfoX/Sxy family protein [Albitalea sp.]|nr:TfoX/Sxy family protein [Albitalea sp.]
MAYDELVAHSIELLQPLGSVRARRMFGGHGLYADDLFVALIAFDQLYLKADEHTRARFEAAGCRPFVYEAAGKQVTLGYFTVPAEAMESPALMQPWARLAVDAALRARAGKRPAAPKRARTAQPGPQAAAGARAKPSTRR